MKSCTTVLTLPDSLVALTATGTSILNSLKKISTFQFGYPKDCSHDSASFIRCFILLLENEFEYIQTFNARRVLIGNQSL